MTLVVPADIEALIAARVAAGAFASAEEALRDAMKAWIVAERRRQIILETVRARVAEGDADNADMSSEQVRASLDALAARLGARADDAA